MGDKLVLRLLDFFETIKCTLEQAHGVPPCSVALHNITLEDKNSGGYPSAKTVSSIDEEKWMVYHVFTTLVTEKNTAPISPRDDPYSLTSQYTGVARSVV